MSDLDALVAKSEAAKVQYRREVDSLQRARCVELAAGAKSAQREAALWREITREQQSPERTRVAHSALAEARRLHAAAKAELGDCSQAARRAEAVKDASSEFLSAVQRRGQLLREGRQADDGLEVAMMAHARLKRGEAALLGDCQAVVPPQAVAPHGGQACLKALASAQQSRSDGVAPLVAAQDALPILPAPREASLSIQCRGPAGASPIGVRLSEAEGQGVSVMVRVSEAGSLSVLLREREAIRRCLADAGIEVKAVTVERGEPQELGSAPIERFRRRKQQAWRDDEPWVA